MKKNKTKEIEFIIDENNRVDFRQVLQMINMYEEKIQRKQTIIDKIKHILNNQINYREFADIVNDIEDILKEAQNEKN